MNLYVQFTRDHQGFLNLMPDDISSSFYYFRLESGEQILHAQGFNDYARSILNCNDETYYLFTPASTPDELCSMHPELFI